MIKKVSVVLSGEAVKAVQVVAKEYQLSLRDAVSEMLGYAATANLDNHIVGDSVDGVDVEGVVEDVYDVGQVIGAKYRGEVVYGAFQGLTEGLVKLVLTDNSMETLGRDRSAGRRAAVPSQDTFTL